MLILITGTSGSGKSEYAEKICCELAGSAKKYYIATMQPYGAEGTQRIRRHHALRQGRSPRQKCRICHCTARWSTVPRPKKALPTLPYPKCPMLRARVCK